MKLQYYPETGALYIELNDKAGADVREIADGVVVDIDAGGNPVGIDIEHASERLDLRMLEMVALPASTTRMAG